MHYPGHVDMEPQYRHELQAAGYEVCRCRYSDITPDLLRRFNVVIMDWAPQASDKSGCDNFLSKRSLIRDFMKQGGGVLLLYENSYDMNYQAPNEFLKEYGAGIINEGLVDPAQSVPPEWLSRLLLVPNGQHCAASDHQ